MSTLVDGVRQQMLSPLPGCACGFLLVREEAQVVVLPASFDLGGPFLSPFVPGDATIPRGGGASGFRDVLPVLRFRGRTQIGATVIETVPVDVIAVGARVGENAEHRSVHQDSGAVAVMVLGLVDRVPVLIQVPPVDADAGTVDDVDGGVRDDRSIDTRDWDAGDLPSRAHDRWVHGWLGASPGDGAAAEGAVVPGATSAWHPRDRRGAFVTGELETAGCSHLRSIAHGGHACA